jgi:hypothetical protein
MSSSPAQATGVASGCGLWHPSPPTLGMAPDQLRQSSDDPAAVYAVQRRSRHRLNTGRPADDFATHGATVAKAIAGVVSAYGTAQDARAYGEKVAHRCCPNILPYEVGKPAVFGFAEWNGRSVIDNAPVVMFSIAANTPIPLGIGKDSVTSKPLTTFPYVPAATLGLTRSSV